MIISRAAAAALPVLSAGLGKGHVQLGALCIPWGRGDTDTEGPWVLPWPGPSRSHGG